MTVPENITKVERVCSECDNDNCKCQQIMSNLADNIDLTNQIGHHPLHNIFLTIFIILQNIETNEDDLIKIADFCHDIYKDINPKKMGHTLN